MFGNKKLRLKHIRQLRQRREHRWNSTGFDGQRYRWYSAGERWHFKRTWWRIGPKSVAQVIKNATFADDGKDAKLTLSNKTESNSVTKLSIVSRTENDKDRENIGGRGNSTTHKLLNKQSASTSRNDIDASILTLYDKSRKDSNKSQNTVLEIHNVVSIDDLVNLIDNYYGKRHEWQTALEKGNPTLAIKSALEEYERKLKAYGIDHNELYSAMLNYYQHNSWLTNLFHLFVADADFGFTGYFEKVVIFDHSTNGLETVFNTPALEYIFFGGVAVAATIGFLLHTVATFKALRLKDQDGNSVYNKKQKAGLMLDWLVQLGATVCIDWAIGAALWQRNAQTATMMTLHHTAIGLLPGLFLISLGLQFLSDFGKFCFAFRDLCKAKTHDERRVHSQKMMYLGLKMIKTALMGAFVGLIMIAGVSNPITLGVVMGAMLFFALGLFIWDHLPKSCQRSIKSKCSFFRKDSYKREEVELVKIEAQSVNKNADDIIITPNASMSIPVNEMNDGNSTNTAIISEQVVMN
ncbi:MAG: hypothetical protein GY821_08240 [Gammaproteobacteria bacterium]|nr:hypothetical protein [Gammaproteobacteria bacterium]